MGPVNIGELVPLTKNQTYAAFTLVHKTGVHGYADDSCFSSQIRRYFENPEKNENDQN